MISVTEAFDLVQNALPHPVVTQQSLPASLQHVLGQDIFAPISLPPFDQATMDGFALALHDSLAYEIIGEIKAGDATLINIKPGQAVKIFTGASVPSSAQAVIQIEQVQVQQNELILSQTTVAGTNIRVAGAQIKQGDLALAQGTFLSAAAIGFLAGLGIAEISVFKKPSIGIVVNGNELLAPDEPLTPGKVYNSNAVMLESALRQAHFIQIKHYQTLDDLQATEQTLQKALGENDFVLISGGISVGDYDFVGKALAQLKVENLFYKVNQKPGKPLWFGRKNHQLVWALPGNPAASLTCFYLYVLPALQQVSGFSTSFKSEFYLPLAHDYEVNNMRDQFLKARIIGEQVHILPHQDSAMLDSFVQAHGLAYVAAGKYALQSGDKVALYTLPQG
ncbi:molybdopterin molybdotransferase MoeA [Flavobacterium sp. CYK-55]|uniref:molybdopterin molybdotransferase MoeA n=1 Tax=Flavobacterium sp. CYK-55 TaxID=2835529 RepID=UPI001BCEECC3|nr:molybdopterin molybdotransferase MoeA [Flavobacterium sp. CYK-55]MBS7786963.1 molybdopterin molybdotransferase MoeA [Flavobacterium sp. CYK-55]